jgi:5-methylcytosine-specific restriction endonuclease McrA
MDLDPLAGFLTVFRPCLGCGEPTERDRCPRCRAPIERSHHNRAYDSLAWRRFRSVILTRHRARHGDLCPGAPGHPAHPERDLTVDHIEPLARGGAMFSEANCRVLCRSWNGKLGAQAARASRGGSVPLRPR